MKKRFLTNPEAESLWDAMEAEEFIEVKGGQSDPMTDKVSDGSLQDHSITLAKWALSF